MSAAGDYGRGESPAVHLTAPLSRDTVAALRVGQNVLITGTVLTARDAAHRRLVELFAAGEGPPFPLEGEAIYYTGPSPARPGAVLGSAGPTTAGRMDRFTEALLERGVLATIGKGSRSPEVRIALRRHGAVYLAAVGGAGALLSERILAAEVIAFPELGPEAVHRLRVRDFPAVVANDTLGGDLFEDARTSTATREEVR